jgi:hypothetical protein
LRKIENGQWAGMTYNQARVRISVYWFLAGVVLPLGTFSIVLTALAKGAYSDIVGSGCSSRFCVLIQNAIAFTVNDIFFLGWWWVRLGDVPFDSWYLALLSPIGLCAAYLLPLSLFFRQQWRDLRAALREARHRARVESFNPKSNSQLVGPIQAGGNVSVEQTINNNPEIRDWDKSFSKSPLGQIIIAVVGGLLVLLAGKLIIGS